MGTGYGDPGPRYKSLSGFALSIRSLAINDTNISKTRRSIKKSRKPLIASSQDENLFPEYLEFRASFVSSPEKCLDTVSVPS